MKLLKSNFVVLHLLFFICGAMQESDESALQSFLATTPQPVREAIEYYKPLDSIANYFEKHREHKVQCISAEIFEAYDRLEYHTKILVVRLFASQMTPKVNPVINQEMYEKIKGRLKAGIKKTPIVNQYFKAVRDERAVADIVYLASPVYLISQEEKEQLSNRLRTCLDGNTMIVGGIPDFSFLKEKYNFQHPCVFKGVIREIGGRKMYKVSSLVIPLPFAVLSFSSYQKDLSERIDKIFQEEINQEYYGIQ